MIRKMAALTAAFGVLFLSSDVACAIDGLAVELGRGDDGTSLLRFAITDYWRKPHPPDREWRLAGYWEFSAGLWDNAEESTANIGIAPVLRTVYGHAYVEAALGLHLVTTHISASRVFSTSFQFGSHFGAGVRFGEESRYDLGVRLQHISNAGLNHPNPGINFVLVRLQYLLD